jgi:catechol 2,3-dioxygenase-like lactoylglutathione lyase family enzyme
MASQLIEALRSVALTVPDLEKAEAFYTTVWQLQVAARTPDEVFFSGSGADHHLLALKQASGPPKIRYVTLRATSDTALQTISAACERAGCRVLKAIGPNESPAGGRSVTIVDVHQRIFEIVFGDQTRNVGALLGDKTASEAHRDQPIKLAHVVLNSHDVEASKLFLENVLDMRLIDRTGIMAFMNCNSDHHSIAIGITDNDALNHIAFVMPNVDAVMRGGGRMRDAGHSIEWGPGRHGPGNNTFNYFIDPFGIVIEYTADVEQVDDTYRVRMPKEWTWPVGRVDQWGISAPPSAKLKDAQKYVHFEYLPAS